MARRYLWLVVAVLVGLFMALLMTGTYEPPGWAQALLFPGIIGSALVGGVHGGAQEWAEVAAASTTAGLFWGGIVLLAFRLPDAVRKRTRSTPGRGA